MEYYLMHKDDTVAKIDIDSSCKAKKLKIINKDLLPIGGQMNEMKFSEWWFDRAVPKTRAGFNDAIKKFNCTTSNQMLIDNLALSLNDCYWICPVGKDISWEEVSLFNNNFVDSFANYSMNCQTEEYKHSNIYSVACQGDLYKKWTINEGGQRIMIKSNYGDQYQQSINEVYASLLHSCQDKIPFVEYWLTPIKISDSSIKTGCACKNFCSNDIESISLWEMLQSIKDRPSENYYMKTKKVLVDNFGMNYDYFTEYMDYLIMTDFILSNTDRHMNNIALLRNTNTLEFIGFSPIYDTGNSMFFRNTSMPIGNLREIRIHSFYEKELDMLKLVKNRNAVDLNKIPTKEQFIKLYSHDVENRHYRIEHLYKAFIDKCSMLNEFQNGKNIWEKQRVIHRIK